MKKLLILVVVGFILVGCSSSKSDKEANGATADNKVTKEDDKTTKDKDEKESAIKSSESDEKTTDSSTSKDDKKTANGGSPKKSDSYSANTDTENGNTSQNNASSSADSTQSENSGELTKPSVSVETPPVQDPVPDPATNQSAKADQVFAQINAYRVQNGKEAFAYSSTLKQRCDSHALEMASAQGLWHSGAAECITNADDPFSAWINSPAHLEILMCNNSQAAVGIYYYNGYYYSVFQTRV